MRQEIEDVEQEQDAEIVEQKLVAPPKKQTAAQRRKAEQMALVDIHGEGAACRRCESLSCLDNRMNAAPGRALSAKLKKPLIYFVGSAPSYEDVRKGEFFSGPIGYELITMIEEAGIKDSQVYLDNLVRCGISGDLQKIATTSRKKLTTNCAPYLISEIERLKPKVIVTLGNVALKALTGLEGIDYHGRAIMHRELNAWVLPTFHPALVARGQYALKDKIVEDLQTARGLLKEPLKFSKLETIFVKTDAQFDAALSEMEAAEEYVVDLETTGLNRFEAGAKIIGLSLGADMNRGYFLPLWVPKAEYIRGETAWTDKPMWKKSQMNRLRRLMADKKKVVLMHNAAFDDGWLNYFEFFIARFYDTMLANSIFTNFDNGLKDLSWVHTDFGGYEDAIEADLKEFKKKFALLHPDKLAYYGALDAVATYRVRAGQKELLQADPNPEQERLVATVVELRKNLNDMEATGAMVDLPMVEKLIPEYEKELNKIQKKINKLYGQEINLNSEPQLSKMIYGAGGLFPGMNGTTEKDQIEKLQKRLKVRKKLTPAQHKANTILGALLTHRKKEKLLSTYLMAFREKNVNGCMHTSFTQHVTVTGRLSSVNINLQNIPRAGDIKNCFIARPGHLLAELDQSQLELRIVANVSKDTKMLELLNSGADLHSFTGVNSIKQPNGKPYDVSKFMDGELRAAAKIISFSVVYGKTPYTLADDLSVSVPEAAKIQGLYFETFPELYLWIKEQHDWIKRHNYIETLFGRRISIYGGDSRDEWEVSAAQRKAVNYQVQSPAADCVATGINRISRIIRKEKMPVKRLLTVHDSILLEVPEKGYMDYLPTIKHEFEKPMPQIKHAVLRADCKVGYRWGSLEKVKL